MSDLFSGQCRVAEEYTVMTPDRLLPAATLLRIEADTAEQAWQYLRTEPLTILGKPTPS